MDSYILMNGLCNQSVDCVSKEIRNLEECAWKKELGASLELIKKRLNIFPNGLWRLYHNAKLVSYMYYIRIDERKKYYSWFIVTSKHFFNFFHPFKRKFVFNIPIFNITILTT